jgi:maltose O-acetyltransferase
MLRVALRLAARSKARAMFPAAQGLNMDVRTDIKYPHNIRLGANVVIGRDCQIGAMAPVVLGDYVRLSRGVTLETATLDLSSEVPYRHIGRPITLGAGVWLGAHVTVLGGVTIGDGAVIGAGTTVARDVPAGSILVGAAPRIVGSIGRAA